MEDEASQKNELETFNLELTPWQLYSLNTILQYNMVNMEDPMYTTATQVLAKEVHDTIASQQFMDAMDEQKDVFDEREREIRQEMDYTPNSMGRGVQ